MSEVLHHHCVAGLLTESMIKIVGRDGNDYIANVDFILGEGTRRAVRIYGQILLIETKHYDMVAFALLRDLFGFGFPQLLIVDYMGGHGQMLQMSNKPPSTVKMIMTKRFPDRELRESDYFPFTQKNFEFRYRLCLLVYFCKFVGCWLSLRDIRVMNGIPFIWRCRTLGLRDSKTISEEEFSLLFGVEPKVAHAIFHSVDHCIIKSNLSPASNIKSNTPSANTKETTESYERSDLSGKSNLYKSITTEKEQFFWSQPVYQNDQQETERSPNGEDDEELWNESSEDSLRRLPDAKLVIDIENLKRERLEGMTDSELLVVETPNVSYDDLKGTMFQLVVEYFRDVNFDKDYIREALLIRENAVRGAKRYRQTFPLSQPCREISALLEENYAHLMSSHPFRIFS